MAKKFDIDSLTIKEARELARTLGSLLGCGDAPRLPSNPDSDSSSDLVGRYVIVRCRDAGVHAGILHSHKGRECALLEAKRLWSWKPTEGRCFLSGVATGGLASTSRVSDPVEKIILTENCEIILCSKEAEESIRRFKPYRL